MTVSKRAGGNSGDCCDGYAELEDRSDVGLRGDIGAICNMSLAILGPGVLSIPFALASAGTGLGLVMMLVAMWMNDYTVLRLLDVSLTLPPGTARTYENVAMAAGGARFGPTARSSLQGGLVLVLFGFICGNMVAVVQLVEIVAHAADIHISHYLVLVIVVFGAMAPLSTISKLDTLGRFSSPMGVVSLLLLGAVALFQLAEGGGEMVGWRPLARFDSVTLVTFPLATFAFTVQPYIFTIFFEDLAPAHYRVPAEGESAPGKVPVARLRRVTHAALFLSLIIYSSVGYAGVLRFGEAAKSNVISNYNSEDVSTLVMCVVMITTILACFPVNVFPLRAQIDAIFFDGKEQSRQRFLIETLCIVVAAFLVSACPGISIGKVFNITGSTGCMFVSYLLPCIFTLQLEKPMRYTAVFVGVFGTLICLVSLYVIFDPIA